MKAFGLMCAYILENIHLVAKQKGNGVYIFYYGSIPYLRGDGQYPPPV